MKKNSLILAVFVTLVLTLLFALRAGASDVYGVAKFYRNDAWSKSGLIDHWQLDPGTRGDWLYGYGNFELWDGAEGGCTRCPTNWTCTCATGNIDREGTEIYKSNYSLEIDPDNANVPYIYYPFSFVANTCYQVTFWYRGVAATEDLRMAFTNVAMTDAYNPATDTWGAINYWSATNISTAWTMGTVYITTGAVAKPTYTIMIMPGSGDGTLIYFDDLKVQELNRCNPIGSRLNVLSVPVTSDPIWGRSETLLPRVGTGPSGWWGMQLETNDRVYSSDAAWQEPQTYGSSFSAACRLMHTSVAGTQAFIGKFGSGTNQRSWLLYQDAGSVYFGVSDDGTGGGGHLSTYNTAAVLAADRVHSVLTTFNNVADGTSTGTIVVDNSTTNGAALNAPPFNATWDFEVGAYNNTSGYLSAYLAECSFFSRALSAIESSKWNNPYFPGTDHGDGFYVTTCTQAASHATCSSQKCRNGTPGACQAEGTGTMAVFGSYTEQLDNNSFETNVGTDSAPDWSNWTETVVPDTGTARLTAYRADTKHGNLSARMYTIDVPTGNPYVMMDSECLVAGIGAATEVCASLKKISGIGEVDIGITEMDDGACAGPLLGVHWFVNDLDPGVVWTDYCYQMAAGDWNASTSSYYVTIRSYSSIWGSADVLADITSLKVGTLRTPWVHNPSGTGTTTYNLRNYQIHNPLSDFIQSRGAYGYAGGFCVSMWIYTDWAGNNGIAYYFINSPGTVGNNNRWFIAKSVGNDLMFRVYDSGATLEERSLVGSATNWSAGNWKYIEACHNNSGTLAVRHYNVGNSTWYAWSTSSGAMGSQNGQSSYVEIGNGSGASLVDGYISEIQISPYSAVFPMKGWNNGRPPYNDAGRPY